MAAIVFVPCQQWFAGQQLVVAPMDMLVFAGCNNMQQTLTTPLMESGQNQMIMSSEMDSKPQQSSSSQVHELQGSAGRYRRMQQVLDSPPEAVEMDSPPESISGNVWELSRSANGCRRVQQALEDASSDAMRAEIAGELTGHIWLAVRCPNAHHVIQKCISTMRPAATQFIIDEISAKGPNGVRRIAKDRYGCRVFQRLLEHCRDDQVEPLIEPLLTETPSLSRHIYANFVMQHILEHGTEAQREHVMVSLEANIASVAADIHGSAVVGAAFSLDVCEHLTSLIQAVLQEIGLIVAMSSIRHGQAAVKRLLQLVEGDDMVAACKQLSAGADTLSETRYGRGVMGCVSKLV